MKIADKCRADIHRIISEYGIDGTISSSLLAHHLRKKAWAVTGPNMNETARSLGFTVIGDQIYDLDM